MKKVCLLCAACILTAGIAAAAESSIEIKGGVFLPYGEGQPNQLSVDGGIAFNFGVDKAFTFGIEADINWVDMSAYTVDGLTTHADNNNLYVVPVFVTARFRFWQFYQDFGVLPYIHLGLGYSVGFHVTDLDPLKLYGGLSWMALAGVAFKLHESSNVNLLIEAGAKGLHLQLFTDSSGPKMIGFIARAGVRFAVKFND